MEVALRQNPPLYEWVTQLFQRCVAKDAAKEGLSLPVSLPRSPVDRAIDEMRDKLYWLQANFADKSARIAVAMKVKEALRELEEISERYELENLTRVAAILHDTLRYNPIETFDERQLRAFLEASRQATDVAPSDSDPTTCLQALWRGGLDWLPPVNATWDDSDMDDDEDEEVAE